MNEQIEIGDYVEVIFNEFSFDGKSKLYGKLIHRPVDTGDIWEIETCDKGTDIVYVTVINQQSASVERIIRVYKKED